MCIYLFATPCSSHTPSQKMYAFVQNRFRVHLRVLDVLSMFSIHSYVACEENFGFGFLFTNLHFTTQQTCVRAFVALFVVDVFVVVIIFSIFSVHRERLCSLSKPFKHLILHSSNAIRFVCKMQMERINETKLFHHICNL